MRIYPALLSILLTFTQSSVSFTLLVLNNGKLTLIIFFQVNFKACIIECFFYALALFLFAKYFYILIF